MVSVYIIANKLSKSHPRYEIQQTANSVYNMGFNYGHEQSTITVSGN